MSVDSKEIKDFSGKAEPLKLGIEWIPLHIVQFVMNVVAHAKERKRRD